jgi:hypothetical protein
MREACPGRVKRRATPQRMQDRLGVNPCLGKSQISILDHRDGTGE